MVVQSSRTKTYPSAPSPKPRPINGGCNGGWFPGRKPSDGPI